MGTRRLLIMPPYHRPHIGGVESYVEELNSELASHGVAVTVLAPDVPAGAPARERTADGVRIIRMPAVEAVPNFPVPSVWRRTFWRALRAATSPRPDVVVTHTRFFLTSLLGGVVATVLRCGWVHVEHGSDFVQYGGLVGRVARAYDATLGRLVLRSAGRVIGVSGAAATFVQRLSGRRAAVLYRGIRPERLEPLARTDMRERAAGRPVIAYVGRLVAGKGVVDLLAALDGLEPAVLCCIVGDGTAGEELRAAATSLEGRHDVWLMGQLPEPDAFGVLRAADVVVNPSYTEGLPTSVLLAALAGVPVVATDVGGTREIVGHHAELVAPRDPVALRAALARVLADEPGRRAMAQAAQADARARFRWGLAVEGLLQLCGEAQPPLRARSTSVRRPRR